MHDTPRWLILVVAALLVVGLLAFARGRDHHRGDDVGERADAGETTPPTDTADGGSGG